MFRVLSFMTAALFLAAPALAQDKTDEVDKIFSWVKPGDPGCSVAVSQNGRLVVYRGTKTERLPGSNTAIRCSEG